MPALLAAPFGTCWHVSVHVKGAKSHGLVEMMDIGCHNMYFIVPDGESVPTNKHIEMCPWHMCTLLRELSITM